MHWPPSAIMAGSISTAPITMMDSPPLTSLPPIYPPAYLPVPGLMAEAQRLEAVGFHAAAEAIYRHILSFQPGVHPALHALGLLALAAGKLPLAAEYLVRAVAADDRVGIYQRNLGEMLRRLGRVDEAIAAGQRATALMPDDLDAHYNLGLALADAQRFGEAVASYRRALLLNPNHGLSWNNMGSALVLMDAKKDAEEAFAVAIRINPRHTEAQNNMGVLHSEQGDLEAAQACFEKAIAAQPDFTEAHFNLSPLKNYLPDDPHVAILESLLQSSAALPAEARIRYLFALGKAREDTGRHDESFAAYTAGNQLQYALRPWDDTQGERILSDITCTFDQTFFAAKPPAGTVSDIQPIFIVGMPRSGTTLLEQILASHPAVFGAGELKDFSEIVEERVKAANAANFPAWASMASADDFAAIGHAYLERLRKMGSGKMVITDKMPGNFFLIGLIRMALPNAKIIHSMREPMDSCFSCYTRLFKDAMDFTYDLGALGRYCARYLKLMEHWHRVLPPGTILDQRYEDMVADTEGQVRRLLEHLGLPWDAGCLAFHKNKRRVQTASVAQVRKPIYKTSVARWQHFERHLQPLRAALNSLR